MDRISGAEDQDAQILRGADPNRHRSLSNAEAEVLLTKAIAAAEARHPAPWWRKNRMRTLVGAAVGLVLLGGAIAVPSVAENVQFFATTDVRENSEPGFASDVSSPPPVYVDKAASDYVAFALTIYDMSLPVPPGVDRVDAAKHFAEAHSLAARTNFETGVVQSEDGMRADWEGLVRCYWISDWQASNVLGSESAKDRAAAVVKESFQWPMYLRFQDQNGKNHFAEFAEQMAAGDAAAVAENYNALNCAELLEESSR